MNTAVDKTPFFALVDDDVHSAQLLARMLLAHGSPRIVTFAGATDAVERLVPALIAPNILPTLVLVDLKSHSGANLEFVTTFAPIVAKLDIPVVIMMQPAGLQMGIALHDAGAAAIFTRQSERDAYRREAANIVSFWARHQRLDAVGM